MEVKYLWLIIFLALTIAGTVIFVLRLRKKQQANAVLVANTLALTKIPSFVKKYKRYAVSVIAATIALGLVLSILVISSGRLIKSTTVTPEQYNRDIMLCLDVSSSMFPFDEAITDTYLKLIDGFKGERVSMVVWNSTAYQEFPFTDDYAFLKEQLTEMKDAFAEAEDNPDKAGLRFYGTINSALSSSSLAGDGLAACAMKFDKQETDEERHRSIVLSTDNAVLGEETIKLAEATDMLKERDIKLYTIDPYGDSGSEFSNSLRKETEKIDGTYFSLNNGEVSENIIEQVNQTQINSFKGEKRKVIFDEPNILFIPLVGSFLLFLFFVGRGKV